MGGPLVALDVRHWLVLKSCRCSETAIAVMHAWNAAWTMHSNVGGASIVNWQ